eukprot:COSAG01_NODE_2663_length_7293_cov_5.946483_2_plen_55_part_00
MVPRRGSILCRHYMLLLGEVMFGRPRLPSRLGQMSTQRTTVGARHYITLRFGEQ